MPRKRSAKKTVESPVPTGFKWIIGVSAAVTAMALASTAYTSQTLQHVMNRLAQRQEQLWSTNKDAIESIDEWFERQEVFLVKIARQSQPARDLATIKLDYQSVFSRFVRIPHYLEEFPARVAMANYRLGQLHALDGDNTAAIEFLRSSIRIAEQEQFDEQVALARNTLGCVLAALGKFDLSLEQFTQSKKLLELAPTSASSVSIVHRNLGLLQQLSGADGTQSVRESVRLLSADAVVGEFSAGRELLIDSQMTLCEMLWSQGKISEATDACREARVQLQSLLMEVQDSSLDSDLAALNRYLNAIRFTDRNLESLKKNADNPIESQRQKSADAWQWQRLVSLVTEIVPEGLPLEATMCGEFEEQSGLVLAWGMFDWTHDVVTEIIRLVHDRVQLLVLVDNDESLDEAMLTLDSVGVPTEHIRFAVCNYESPWFRDMGPLVGKSASGNWIWFDSCLTRASLNTREVTDALPRIIRRNWDARLVPTPLHIEGGAILSNGKGLTICSSNLIDANRQYGFDDRRIDRELRRITGAKTVAVIDPLVGERTGHIDLFVTFTDERTVVVGEYRHPHDRNRQLLNEHAKTLSQLGGAEKLRVVRIPMPDQIDEVFRTYTNVIYANGVLLVPSYSDAMDAKAREVYQRLLPDWRIEFIDCTRLSAKGGALHCLVSNLGNTPYTPMPIRIRSKAANPR